MEKSNKKCIGVCIGGSCYNAGSEAIMRRIEETYHCEAGSSNDSIDFDYTGCLGHCDFGVNVEINGDVYTNVTKETIIPLLDGSLEQKPFSKKDNDTSLDDLLTKELENL